MTLTGSRLQPTGPPPVRLRPAGLTVATIAPGRRVTAAVVFIPDLRFAYRSERTHLVLETFDASIAGLVALLLYGRFRRSHAVPDLMLSYAMALLAVAAMGFATIPLLSGADYRDAVSTWAPLLLRMLGAGMFAAAALAPLARVSPRRPPYEVVVLLATVGVVLGAALAFPHALPVAVDPTLAPEESSSPSIGGHPGVLTAQAVNLSLYSVAALAFTRRATRTGDELTAWIGAAAGLSATARVNYLLFPSVFSEYVYTGDFLRTGFYLVLLIGATREIQQYWAAMAGAAVLDERQRVARDLHDGLTQELTYIWSQLQQLDRHPERREVLPRLTSASARAIDEARRAIAALTRPMDEPLAVTLTQAAEEVAGRYGANVTTDIDPVEVDGERREALIRIVREAVGNAARYADAGDVVVLLAEEDGAMRLLISDDGRGFDPDDVRRRNSGYGLTTMQQRAEHSGGRFELASRPGGGTTVRVVWGG